MSDNNLASYLNNHLGGSVAGIELAYDCLSRNRGLGLEDFLQRLIQTLEEEQNILKICIARLNAGESAAKKLGGWIFEKMGRINIENPLTGYTNLSRLMELEALAVGLEGQLRMWRLMETHFSNDPRFLGLNFGETIARVQSILEELDRYHLKAGDFALKR